MSDKSSHKETIGEFLEAAKEAIRTAQEAKANLKVADEQLRVAARDLDSYVENQQKIVAVVSPIPPEATENVSDDVWKYFQMVGKDISRQIGSLNAVANEGKLLSSNTGTIAAMTSGALSSSSVNMSFVQSMITSPEIPIQFRPSPQDFIDTFSDDTRIVTKELASIDKSIAAKFDTVTKNWSISSDGEKWGILGMLRNLVYYQFYDSYSKESDYSKAPWYTPGLRKRSSQAKFFVIGFRKESYVNPTALYAVNKIATESQTNFNDASEYGKKDAAVTLIDATFRKTVSLLKQSLILKEDLVQRDSLITESVRF